MASSLTPAARASLIALLFNNTNFANVGDATGLRGSSTAGSFYISLHTSDPSGGNQSTSESAYTGYARIPVARTSGGFTCSGENVSNAAAVIFAACTAGTETITHFGIGSASSGAGNLMASAPLDSTLAVYATIQPQFDIGSLSAAAAC